MMRSTPLLLALALALTACADDPVEVQSGNDYASHTEAADFAPVVLTKSSRLGLPSTFDGHTVMSDAFLNASNTITAGQLQAFLESTPYGSRSWIADAVTPDGRRAADAIIAACQEFQINPIAILARMQVEQGAISQTTPRNTKARDYTLGCGCPDNQPCNTAYKGLYKQVQCGARTMRTRYNDSINGSDDWMWRRGVAKRTLDGYTITPTNHATASMYAYTPWRGSTANKIGNWLVWNITLRYARHFDDLGAQLPDGNSDAGNGGMSMGTWIGEACGANDTCGFTDGYCLQGAQQVTMCSQSCAGYCPDKAGAPVTFCVDASHFGGAGGGVCTVKADARNGFCNDLGLRSRQLPRYIGGSSARDAVATVCVFDALPSPDAPAPPPEDPAPEAQPEPQPEPEVQPEPDRDPQQRPMTDTPPEGEIGARCEGSTAIRIVDGSSEAVDCAQNGLECDAGWCYGGGPGAPVSIGDARCANIDFFGVCDGNLAKYCDASGNLYAQDCVAWDARCGWGDDGDGNWCRR